MTSRYATRILIEGATLVSFDPPTVDRGDLLIENDRIVDRGRRLHPRLQALRVDGRGKVVIPGLVDAYSQLVGDPLPAFTVEGDASADLEARRRTRAAAHSEESVIASGFTAALRALRAGTTCVVDVHRSPAFVGGSLTRLREVLLSVGLRAVVGYRVSGEEGDGVLDDALEETRGAAVYGGSDQLRFGVAAGHPSELTDGALKRLAAIVAETQAPFIGEAGTRSPVGRKETRGRASTSGVARLRDAGLLNGLAILHIGPHLSEEEKAILADLPNVFRVHAPAADMTLDGGFPDLDQYLPGGALGADAGPPDVLLAARLAWTLASRQRPDQDPSAILEMVAGGHRLATRLFEAPFGSLEPGGVADLVILDYQPLWPLNAQTVAQHLAAGFGDARVDAVMVDGRLLVQDGALTSQDASDLLGILHRGSLDYWQTLTGAPFPGWSSAYEDALDADDEDDEDAFESTAEASEESEADFTRGRGEDLRGERPTAAQGDDRPKRFEPEDDEEEDHAAYSEFDLSTGEGEDDSDEDEDDAVKNRTDESEDEIEEEVDDEEEPDDEGDDDSDDLDEEDDDDDSDEQEEDDDDDSEDEEEDDDDAQGRFGEGIF